MDNIEIKHASPSDIEELTYYIYKYKLDGENISHEQFKIAKAGEKLAGFGRIKRYNEVFELCSVGVIEEFRNNKIGTKLVNNLIETFPGQEIWLTTRNFEYFQRFGFQKCHTPPEEIKLKQQKLCQKLNGDINSCHYMLLKKNNRNQICSTKSCSLDKCEKND